MVDKLASRTGQEMFNAAEGLVTILRHKRQSFSHANLVTIAGLMRGGHIDVKIDEDLTYKSGAHAVYLPTDDVLVNNVEKKCFDIAGDILFLPIMPGDSNFTRAVLAHEAVHISADLLGKDEFRWDNEELAFFVEAFIYARLDELTAKRYARFDNHYLIGCLASDYYSRNPKDGIISSRKFNKPIKFDYTKEGGVKGMANPYSALENMVRTLYPQGKKDGKKTKINFNGLR